jgi:hypothetical protein
MAKSRRGADGRVVTFPDGMSDDAIEFAMVAHNNRDSWPGG